MDIIYNSDLLRRKFLDILSIVNGLKAGIMDSPMRRYMLAAGLSCRALAREMGKSKSSGAGKVNGSIPWQQSDLVWLAIHRNLSPGYVLGIDAYLTDGGWKPATRIPEPAGTRRGD